MKRQNLLALLAASLLLACGSDNKTGDEVSVADTGDAEETFDLDDGDIDDDVDEDADAEDTEVEEDEGPVFPVVVVAVETRLSAERVNAGESVYVYCDVFDQSGEMVELGEGVGLNWIVAPSTSLLKGEESNELIAAISGNASISCMIPSLGLIDPTPAELTIDPGPPYTILTEVDDLQGSVGQYMDVNCTSYDMYGNFIARNPATPMDVLVSPFREGIDVIGQRVTIWRTGIYDLTCSAVGAADLISTTIEIIAGLPWELIVGIVPDKPVYAVGDVVSMTWTVLDQEGNIIPAPPVRFSSAPLVPGFGEGRFRFDREGLFTLSVLVLPPTAVGVPPGEPLVGSIDVIVNERGPDIECDFPLHGTMLDGPPGAPVLFEGHTFDEFGVTRVLVNGVPASIRPDGSFVLDVVGEFGHNFLHVEAFDELGSSSKRTCVFLMADQWIPEAGFFDDDITLDLTQAGIDDYNRAGDINSLNDIIYTILNSTELQTQINNMVLASNPLMPTKCITKVLGICLLKVGVEARHLRIGGPQDSALTLLDGGLRLSVDIRNLNVGLRIRGTFGTSGEIRAASFGLTLSLNVGMSGGRPRVSVRSVDRVEVGRLSSSFSGLTGLVIDIVFRLFEGTVRNMVRDELRKFVQNEVANMLDEMFSEMDISAFDDNIIVPRLDSSGFIEMGFGMRFSTVDFNTARGRFGIGTRFTAAITHGGETFGAPQPPGPAIHAPSPVRTVKVGINLGLLNQILHTLWRDSMFDANLGMAEVGLPAGMNVELRATLPPVVTGLDGDNIEFHLGAMQVQISYPALLPGVVIFDLGAKVRTGVDVLPGDEIDFRDFEITDFYFDAIDANLDGETTRDLENFMVDVVQYVVDSALNSALPAFPIPTFELPSSLATFGLPAGSTLGIQDPVLNIIRSHFLLQGNFGIR